MEKRLEKTSSATPRRRGRAPTLSRTVQPRGRTGQDSPALPPSGRWGVRSGSPAAHDPHPEAAHARSPRRPRRERAPLSPPGRRAGAAGERLPSSSASASKWRSSLSATIGSRIGQVQPILRVHQEDLCQALAVKPTLKYENEGGPGVTATLVSLLRAHPLERKRRGPRYVRRCAPLLNWLIAGTDGHAKNYSILIGGGGRVPAWRRSTTSRARCRTSTSTRARLQAGDEDRGQVQARRDRCAPVAEICP